jgi:glycosyltransferase involved in cell wall biosynthesis
VNRVTVAVPSYNQGKFLEDALSSILAQDVGCEICLADGGSADETSEVIDAFKDKLHWWRSEQDAGQSAAINEAVSRGSADYVCWINSDDRLIQDSLTGLVDYLDRHPDVPAVYGNCWFIDEEGCRTSKHFTQSFSEARLQNRCFISQPSTLIRRSVWEYLGGVNEELHMVMDYDLWWRIYMQFGEMKYLPIDVSEARLHRDTKTSKLRKRHYSEAMATVKFYGKRVPLIWYLKYPWSVWYKSYKNQ